MKTYTEEQIAAWSRPRQLLHLGSLTLQLWFWTWRRKRSDRRTAKLRRELRKRRAPLP